MNFHKAFKMKILLRCMSVTWLIKWIAPLIFLEYTPTNEKSFDAFNKERDKGDHKVGKGDHEGERVAHININAEFNAEATQPAASATATVEPETITPTQALTTAYAEPRTITHTQDSTSASVEPVVAESTQQAANSSAASIETESVVVNNDISVLDFNQSTENSSDSYHQNLFNEGDAECDVHEKKNKLEC